MNRIILKERLSCPLCQSGENILARRGVLNDGNFTIEQLAKYWIRFIPGGHFDYFKCKACSSMFNKYYPCEKDLDALYNKLGANMEVYSEPEILFETQKKYANYLFKVISKTYKGDLSDNKKSLRFLEIGSDDGKLAKACLGIQLPICQYDCIEPNANLKNQLHENLSIYQGLKSNIYRSLSEVSGSKNIKYDLIVGIHVLDHIADLHNYLIQMKDLLDKNGLMFFVFHNPNSLLTKVLRRFWPPFCSQHPQLITRNGMIKAAAIQNLKVVSTLKTTNRINLKQIFRMAGFKINKGIGLLNHGFDLNLGNHGFVLTHKKDL